MNCIGINRELEYKEKINCLAKKKVSLWDIYERSVVVKKSSQDKDIVGGVYNDVFGALKEKELLSTLKKIILCGVTGDSKLHVWGFCQYFHKEIAEAKLQNKNLEIILLPSTSPRVNSEDDWHSVFPPIRE